MTAPQGGGVPARATGRFVKGKSGNPGGVPKKGEKVRRDAWRKGVLELASDKGIRAIPQVVDMLVREALAGNMSAAKMLLDRAIPAHRATDSTSVKAVAGIQIIVQGMPTDSVDSQTIPAVLDGAFTEFEDEI